MAQIKRRHFFVDQKVQSALMLRAVMYWIFCLVSMSLMVLCWTIVTSPPQPSTQLLKDLLYRYAPAIFASLLLLPMVVIDCMRFSHRFVGPMVRFRRALRSLAEGRRVVPLVFRDTDFWQELAEEFNELAARVQSPVAAAGEGRPEDRSRAEEPATEECETLCR